MGLLKKLRKKFTPDPNLDENYLFDGDGDLFKKILPQATVYGEYGCGKSTRWVLTNTNATVFSVDSSEDWIQHVKDGLPNIEKFSPHWTDLGELGNWGRPRRFSHHHNFQDYSDWIWQQDQKPDVVLVDGRFRVCCFLTSLKYAGEGTKIIFDDYKERPHYHIVEDFLKPMDTCGRQVVFEVPAKDKIDLEKINQFIAHFRFVID